MSIYSNKNTLITYEKKTCEKRLVLAQFQVQFKILPYFSTYTFIDHTWPTQSQQGISARPIGPALSSVNLQIKPI